MTIWIPNGHSAGAFHIHESKFSEVNLNGDGEIYSYTVIRVPFEEFLDEAPFTFAEVKLDEGLVVPGRITAEGEEIRIGSRVSFVSRDKGIAWFRLA